MGWYTENELMEAFVDENVERILVIPEECSLINLTFHLVAKQFQLQLLHFVKLY